MSDYYAQGACPLDGYQLIETDPGPYGDGTWEHVIPCAEIPAMGQALARIAEAHGFEATAAAEEILRAQP